MGMSNDEIAALMDGNLDDESIEDTDTNESSVAPQESTIPTSIELPEGLISQDEMDSLLTGFVSEDTDDSQNLIDEIHQAILDSGQLSLMQWVKLRERLREIEELIPHIDLIIKLKSKSEGKFTDEDRH